MNPLVATIVGPVATIIVGLGAYFAARKLRASQVRKTDAETGKTEAEAWSLLTGGLTARLTALEDENTTLRATVAELRAEVATAQGEAHSCRIELDGLRRQINPDRTGRREAP